MAKKKPMRKLPEGEYEAYLRRLLKSCKREQERELSVPFACLNAAWPGG